ncbi:hypothetical protein ACWT_3509 [Actinoplanes sp. SE50]|uniref:hypothetical protein n=1 Tax=unclassified Actinoplanes TaxID=2626549 RepID=UPI00023EBD43|nr:MULTISPECIES: hypothetical protein [unclassified Actinoplanes]AEV84532.1 hypothetical protein ACPL_3637 [Actinoplanes sp. SE50/110]ATO82924.1 hypothetical protein ACWT_3509 [Actinoplanes sp. SE50]SLM00332.1 uncharacterized protein ACSP50_3564 [Actinoplanes sp. SE50/110]
MTDPTGFAITVPDSWFEIDVHPDTRNSAISSLVNERVRSVPELNPHRSALTRALRGVARTAHANGAAYCGAMVQGFDEALLTASVTVTIVRAPGEEVEASAVAAQLRPLPRSGADGPWREVVQAELPGIGGVPRTRGVTDVVLPEGEGWIRSVTMQTFVPFPGVRSDRIAVITGSSPILPLAEDLLDLFDAITSTFRFISPDS